MNDLKKKIDAEIGGSKWNDALSEAIQQKAKKKLISTYGIVTFCTIVLACFLLVINWQPTETTPTVQTGDITTIQLKELYVANGEWSQDSFNAKQSTLYLYTKSINDADLHEFNKLFAEMQPITTGYPSYFDSWFQKDMLAIDANNQPWRLKLIVFGIDSAFFLNIDTGELYEYKNEQIGTDNPLNNVIFIFDNIALNSSSYKYIFSLVLINFLIQFIFKMKYNIPFHQRIFEDSKANIIFTTIVIVILISFIIFFTNAAFTYIPAIMLTLLLLLSVYLFIIYRVQTKLYFIRELLTSTTSFIFFSILLFTI